MPSQSRVNQLRAWYLVTRFRQEQQAIHSLMAKMTRLRFILEHCRERPGVSVEEAGVLHEELMREARVRLDALDRRIDRVWGAYLADSWLTRLSK